MLTRVALFMGTNIAVLVVLNVTLYLLGVDRMLSQDDGGLDLAGLLIISAVIGMSGALISLAMSKSMAKRSMRVRVIETPGNSVERWLLDTVTHQAISGWPRNARGRHISVAAA